jgi:hypothetical protein
MRKLIIAALVCYAALAAQPSVAGQFATLNGKFRIAYPDDWKQLDYRLVDSVMFNGNPYPYEGVFAPDSPAVINQEDYLILTVDTTGPLDQHKLDSTIENWAKTLGAEVKKYGAAEDFTPIWRPVEISYWPKSNLACIYTDPKITEGDHTRNQLVVKFYQRGTANFYFYGPDSSWSDFQPIIKSIVNSFSTENIEAALSHGQVKVVDLNEIKSRSDGSSTESKLTPRLIIAGSAVVVLLAIIVALRARRRKNTSA